MRGEAWEAFVAGDMKKAIVLLKEIKLGRQRAELEKPKVRKLITGELIEIAQEVAPLFGVSEKILNTWPMKDYSSSICTCYDQREDRIWLCPTSLRPYDLGSAVGQWIYNKIHPRKNLPEPLSDNLTLEDIQHNHLEYLAEHYSGKYVEDKRAKIPIVKGGLADVLSKGVSEACKVNSAFNEHMIHQTKGVEAAEILYENHEQKKFTQIVQARRSDAVKMVKMLTHIDLSR